MITPSKLRITIKSAATFGRGDGVAGLVDREIEHDVNGFPFLRGKTLKGLLAESAENVVFALDNESKWRKAKNALFGKPGRGNDELASLHIGDAVLPDGLRFELKKELDAGHFTSEDVLYGLTGIRRQTAMNVFGGPEHSTLRSMRVLLPGVVLEADLQIEDPDDDQLCLLTAACLDLRRAGTGRNRGRGHILVELENDKTTREYFDKFNQAVQA